MTVREIVEAYLKKHGYDGLAGEECGCWLVDEIMICDYPRDSCVPGRTLECHRGNTVSCEACQYMECCEPDAQGYSRLMVEGPKPTNPPL